MASNPNPQPAPQIVGHNVQVIRRDNILTVTIDLTQRGGVSASGKTVSIASTKGNVAVANLDGKAIYLGLNAYVYVADRDRT